MTREKFHGDVRSVRDGWRKGIAKGAMGETEVAGGTRAGQLFEELLQASTCKNTLQAFRTLCRQLQLDPLDHRNFYSKLKTKVTSWKAQALWSKLDKRAAHKEYSNAEACKNTKCLVIGGGPCGLRMAIELALLGAKVVVIEKRDTFSRNNVLHLWPYTINDLRCLGAKKFCGKFCAGAIDHISIRQLQLILLKVCLLVAVEVHVNVEFVKLLEPPEDQGRNRCGWRAEIRPADHPVSNFDFDVMIGANGSKGTLSGFKRKEFRGKLAIAITANFINRNTAAEAKVEEISGVAFIFNQKFFQDLKDETGIDLENIVYYKDNTHYFVMTAKKQSLLTKGVILHDYMDTEMLLSSENVNQEALLSYACEAANFSTNYQLPSLDFATNHYGQPDVAMFDFTCMYASENAAMVRQCNGHQLLVALVGDSLLEPFWPMGTGCARGFLAAFDTAWMVKGWAQGQAPLELLAERESLYRLLPQTTSENIIKNFEQYTIDPATRYPNLNSTCVCPHQVRHLFMSMELPMEHSISKHLSAKLSRKESEVHPSRLLSWCQKQTRGYVEVSDLSSSWKSGLAFCALIHRFQPDLLDFSSLIEQDSAKNNQLAFDIAEREFGIPPVTTGAEMAASQEADTLSMVMYLSRFYDLFHGAPLVSGSQKEKDENSKASLSKSGISMNLLLPKKRISKENQRLEDNNSTVKRRRNISSEEVSRLSYQNVSSQGDMQENKVRFMATQLLAKFEENSPRGRVHGQNSFRKELTTSLGGSNMCHFCRHRVYVLEQLSAEGLFFHRNCFRCSACSATLRLGGHAFDSQRGRVFYCKTHFPPREVSNRPKNKSASSHLHQVFTMGTRTASPSTGLLHHQPTGPQQCSLSEDPDQSKNNHWKWKVNVSSFPALLVKAFTHGKTDADRSHCDPQLSQINTQQESTKVSDAAIVSLPQGRTVEQTGLCPNTTADDSPTSKEPLKDSSHLEDLKPSKKKLMLSQSEKQHLLEWDLTKPLVQPTSEKGWKTASLGHQSGRKSKNGSLPAPLSATAPSERSPTPWQLLTNALRRSFRRPTLVSTASPTKRPLKIRPLSIGSINFGTLFGGLNLPGETSSKSAAPPSTFHPTEASNSAEPYGVKSINLDVHCPENTDLPRLLKEVSQTAGPGEASKDDLASLPSKKLNFFSSLRLRRTAGAEEGTGCHQGQEIGTILTNLRKKASNQQHLESSESISSSEEEMFPSRHQGSRERQQQKQEKALKQQARSEQLKRLHRAQVIQRQLEEVEEKQRVLEEKGVALEKQLRGETDDSSEHWDKPHLLHTWFRLVLKKNKLVRYESELVIFAQELELEETQSQLQQELQKRMAVDDPRKSPAELAEEHEMFNEMVRVVEKRDMLVALLEEQRLKERSEDQDLESLLLNRGYQVHWS
ncbi:protein-methionine sulfoxide oxidase MICAL2-like [Arapaima gigas]